MVNKTLKKKIFYGIFFLVIIMALSSCNEGDKILVVKIESNKDNISEISVIKKSLEKGGFINLDVEVLRKIEPKFDSEYAATDSKGNFFIMPAILNFVGGQGWHFLQTFGMPGDPTYFFVKSRWN